MSTRVDKAVKYVEKRIQDIEAVDPYLNMCLYGKNKQGKTRLAATAPKPLLLDVNEKGTKSARDRKGVKVFEIKKWEDFVFAYWYLRSGQHDFESVIVDTMTQVQDLCMKHVLREAVDADPNKDPAMASKREWGKVAQLLKPQVFNYRNLPMHTIFICQERSFTDEDTEKTERTIDMSGANRGAVLSAVDVIGRVFQKEVRKVNKRTKKETKKRLPHVRVGTHDSLVTGDRFNLDAVLVNPTIPQILEIAHIGNDNSEEE